MGLVLAATLLLAGCENTKRPTVLFFSATWCGPCHSERVTNGLNNLKASGVRIVCYDVDVDSGVADRYGVKELPHFVLIINGQIRYSGNDVPIIRRADD